jgi:hypothetical protein
MLNSFFVYPVNGFAVATNRSINNFALSQAHRVAIRNILWRLLPLLRKIEIDITHNEFWKILYHSSRDWSRQFLCEKFQMTERNILAIRNILWKLLPFLCKIEINITNNEIWKILYYSPRNFWFDWFFKLICLKNWSRQFLCGKFPMTERIYLWSAELGEHVVSTQNLSRYL